MAERPKGKEDNGSSELESGDPPVTSTLPTIDLDWDMDADVDEPVSYVKDDFYGFLAKVSRNWENVISKCWFSKFPQMQDWYLSIQIRMPFISTYNTY